MFVMQKQASWIWPVIVLLPADGGGVQEQRFRARFRLLPQERREALGATAEGTDTMLREAVAELLDLVDEDRQPLLHSPALLEACIGNPWIRAGLLRSYVQALQGQPLPAAAAGN